MVCNNSNPTIIRWHDNKVTQYDASDLRYVRKKDNDSRRFGYFNPHKSAYEVPLDIVAIPRDLVEITQRREEAKSIRSASITEEKKLPAHLRLHQHYSY